MGQQHQQRVNDEGQRVNDKGRRANDEGGGLTNPVPFKAPTPSFPWNEHGFYIGLGKFSDKVTFHMEWYGIVHGFRGLSIPFHMESMD